MAYQSKARRSALPPRPLSDEILDIGAEACGDALHDERAGIAQPALDPGEIGLMDAGTAREFLLREPFRPSQGL